MALEHNGYDARLPESLQLVRNKDVHNTQFEEDGVLRPANVDPNVSFSYSPYKRFNSANQISLKLGVSDWKLEGRHFIFHCCFDTY